MWDDGTIDYETRAHLRFGDNDLGEIPQAGSAFYASYRLGNGQRGNLGAEAINREDGDEGAKEGAIHLTFGNRVNGAIAGKIVAPE